MTTNRAEEGLSSLEALVQQGVNNRLKDVHTCLPGFIDSFDPATQTCSVAPAIKRVFTDGEAIDLPVLTGVPVCFPNAGGFSITFPIAQGDECLIFFSERSIDNWFKFGEKRIPNDRRFFDLSDGFVVLGVRSNPNVLGNYSAIDLVIRNETNDNKLTLKNDGSMQVDTSTLTINGNLSVNGTIEATGNIESTGGDVIASGISLQNHTHPYTWTDGPGSGDTGPAQ